MTSKKQTEVRVEPDRGGGWVVLSNNAKVGHFQTKKDAVANARHAVKASRIFVHNLDGSVSPSQSRGIPKNPNQRKILATKLRGGTLKVSDIQKAIDELAKKQH